MMHCRMIQTGEIQVVVGDAARDGVGGTQYCGLWSLTSVHRAFNAFGNSYAGLLPGLIRGRSPALEPIDDRTCALTRTADDAYPVAVRALYTVREPYYVDHTLAFTDRRDMRGESWERAIGADVVFATEPGGMYLLARQAITGNTLACAMAPPQRNSGPRTSEDGQVTFGLPRMMIR